MYSEVRPSETPASELEGRKGLIISGGPRSVYDPASPSVDPAIFRSGQSVLGICYGQQLMAHLLGGDVRPGAKGEFGFATLELDGGGNRSPLFEGLPAQQQIWMSHRDTVAGLPPGFSQLGDDSHLHHRRHGGYRARAVQRAVSSGSGAYHRRRGASCRIFCSMSAAA